MKKILAIVLALMLVLSLCACGKNDSSNTGTDAGANAGTATATPAPEATPTPAPEAPATMSYAEFCAAELDSAVTIEAYIQSCAYSAAYGNASLFLQDTDGGYYVYRMNVTEDEAKALTPGAKIRVSGYKSEWSGEVEITDATFEAQNGFWMAEAKDVTPYLNTNTLADCINQFVAFKGMTVEPSIDADGNEAAFLYNWDGSGAPGTNSDLYFNVSINGATYNFTVESDECPEGSEVYTAVTNLKIGDTVNMEGFLYWYEGANPHITGVTVTGAASASTGSQYADFCAAELDSEVTVEAYIQSCAYNAEYGNASLFLQDDDGGYYVYRMNVTADEAASLVPGAKIRVTGYKSEWAGEVEIADAAFEALDGSCVYPATDVTSLLGTDELAEKINQFVAFKGMTVEPSTDADGNEAAFLYNWDGSGAAGANSDLYFNVSVNGATYNFTVESDECPEGSEVYSAVTALSIGDTVDLEGFLYWYEGANPHISSVKSASAASGQYADFCAAELDSAVTVEAYIQSCAYNAAYGNASLFLQDDEGGYYVYRMNVTEDEAAALVPGAKIRVSGYKSEWAGEVEIADAAFELLDGSCVFPATDVTALLGTDALSEKINQFVAFKGMTVEPSTDADGNEAAFLYNWDGSGAAGANSDLYFNVSVNGTTYNFTVESDECPEGSEVYTAVTALSVGDRIDLEGFLYWYEGANPHITSVTPAK